MKRRDARIRAIGPLLSYYGGKWRAAPRYPPPLHGYIVEPFAGSAGYSCRYWWHAVVLVERDPKVVAVLRYLVEANPAEIARLPLFEHPGQTVDDLGPLPQEARWLIGWWINKAVVGPRSRPGAWMRRELEAGRLSGQWWSAPVRDRLARASRCMGHWHIVEGDYTDAPDIPATWFIDPPYQVAGRHYTQGAAAIDYPALGRWCRERRGQVIVCEGEGADWLPFEPWRTVHGASRPHLTGRGRSRAGLRREVWWYRETT